MIDKLLESYYDGNIVKLIKEGYVSRVVSLRVNTIKSNIDYITNYLDKLNISYEKIKWYSDALVLNNSTEEDIRKLDIYKNGLIYLQSLSSMLPPLFLEPKGKDMILDMTAAPGSKTTQIAALSNNESFITALEFSKPRYERLKYNLEKQGVKKVTALQINALNLDKYFMFDKILLDAPCSGSGTLTSDNFDDSLVSKCVIKQEKLLEVAIKHLNNNGTIIYSTCSILKSENEDIINKILKKYPNVEIVPINIKDFDLPTLPVTIEGTICIRPTNYYEGFFIAKLVKRK